jgi:hypothetical protein
MGYKVTHDLTPRVDTVAGEPVIRRDWYRPDPRRAPEGFGPLALGALLVILIVAGVALVAVMR